MLANPVLMEARMNNHIANRTILSLESIIDDPSTIYNQSHSASRNPGFTELDVLSASTYPHTFLQPSKADTLSSKRKAPEISTDAPFLGGLLLAADGDNNVNLSSNDEIDRETNVQLPKKKSKKVSIAKDTDGDTENDESSNKRTRGRPRLEKQDETTVDRRRTQIRLAQRAYRNRKESTIASLKKRTEELQNTIVEMNQVFSTLRDNLLNSATLTGQIQLVQQLQAANDQFATLVSVIAESDVDDEAKDTNATSNVKGSNAGNFEQEKPQPTRSGRGSKRIQERNARRTSWIPLSGDVDVEELPAIGNSVKQNSSYFPQQEWINTDKLMQVDLQVPYASMSWVDFVGSNTNTLDPNSSNPIIDFNIANSTNLDFSVERPLALGASEQQSGLYTYSFQETTFARRLHRLTMERNLPKLCNKHIDPNHINRTYRFTFTFTNRDQLIKGISEKLRRKAGEPLENWNAPYFHLGGAGLHFPRRHETTGKAIYPPNLFSPAKVFGPKTQISIENPRDEKTVQESLEALGFGGEWFDSHDVEEYLKTKGIFLEASSSFVDVYPALLDISPTTQMVAPSLIAATGSPATSSDTNSTIRTPSPPLANLDSSILHEDNIVFDPELQKYTIGSQLAHNEKFPETQLITENAWSWADLFPQYPSFPAQNQTTRTLDVDLFLDRMIERGTCLGRAPGFRKDWVDWALMSSLLEV